MTSAKGQARRERQAAHVARQANKLAGGAAWPVTSGGVGPKPRKATTPSRGRHESKAARAERYDMPASREEQARTYLECGPGAWDDRGGDE